MDSTVRLGPVPGLSMESFKLRLVIYFIFLSLLPLVAATWAFTEVARRGETGSADARMSTALRVAIADYAEQVQEDASGTANALARATQVQGAFRTRNRAALVRLSREVPHSAFYSGGELLAGEPPAAHSVVREAEVTVRGGELLGRVIVSLPLDDDLVRGLRAKAGLERPDRFVLVAEGEVFAPSAFAGQRVDVPRQRPRYVDVGGTSYRAIGTELISGQAPVTLLGLTPRSEIEAAAGALRLRFLLFAFVALLAVGIVAYALGRTIVRSLKELSAAAGAVARGQFERRVPARGRDEFAALGRAFNDMASELQLRLEELAAERERVRDTVNRFGEALAATHDPYALLGVIVESTVEATGATGGRLVIDGKEIVRAGGPDEGGAPLAIPLGAEGETAVLYLTPSGSDFTDEARELAHWLGSQASIALENARLHRLVERQASTDGLTELPNRRHFEETLSGEINRAERFGGGLALVLADLDDFKQVNDRFGHQAGDQVLRTFADILRSSVREIDLPARFGGEEFAVLLPQTDLEGAQRLAERLRRALAARPMTTRPGALVAVTASFGVAAFPDARTPAALFAAADGALYRAKRQGKNCVVTADSGATVRVAD
jgi:diguanylate cyclase (GGDEF)-like protein